MNHGQHVLRILPLIASLLIFTPQLLWAEAALAPPQQLQVFDTPSDGGSSLTATWSPSTSDTATGKYQVLLHEGGAPQDSTGWKVLAEFPANSHYVREAKAAWWTRPGPPGDRVRPTPGPDR